MEIRELKTFVEVVKQMGFTKAAKQLGYAQSTVTGHIHNLEEELGTRLFERLGKQMKLTRDGEQLYTYADQILKLSDEAKDVIASSLCTKGSITVGTPESLCTHRLPAVFKAFRERFPRVEFDIRFDTFSDYRTHLRKNTADIIFLLDVPVLDADLITHSLFQEPMAVIAAPSHPLVKKRQIIAEDLNGQALVLTDTGCGYRRIFESILAQAGVKPAAILGVSSNEVIKKFVSDGWGVGFLPLITIDKQLAASELIALPWSGTAFNINAQMVYHRGKWVSPALQAFIDLTLDMLSKDIKRN